MRVNIQYYTKIKELWTSLREHVVSYSPSGRRTPTHLEWHFSDLHKKKKKRESINQQSDWKLHSFGTIDYNHKIFSVIEGGSEGGRGGRGRRRRRGAGRVWTAKLLSKSNLFRPCRFDEPSWIYWPVLAKKILRKQRDVQKREEKNLLSCWVFESVWRWTDLRRQQRKSRQPFWIQLRLESITQRKGWRKEEEVRSQWPSTWNNTTVSPVTGSGLRSKTSRPSSWR